LQKESSSSGLARITPLLVNAIEAALKQFTPDQKISARDLDALLRALLSSERVGSSASGEDLERLKGAGSGPMRVEIILPDWVRPKAPVVLERRPDPVDDVTGSLEPVDKHGHRAIAEHVSLFTPDAMTAETRRSPEETEP